MTNEFERWTENKKLYRALVHKMSFEEKLWLLENKGDYDVYEKRLRLLVKRHAVVVPKKEQA